jgi:hypothetical protein
MNPTDQARKEARRRELKKNKKQRQIVRDAVLRSKNVRELCDDLDRLEEMGTTHFSITIATNMGKRVNELTSTEWVL